MGPLSATLSFLAVASPAFEGEALLNELQQRAFLYFWNESHPSTGFTKDRASNFAGDSYTVSSCAATGFALPAYVIGVERRWANRAEALRRTRLTLKSLYEVHEHKNGWFVHFLDWQTGKRMWNSEYSTIDTGILVAGMIAAERYWKDPEVTRWSERILKRIDWKWARTDGGARPDQLLIGHGYIREKGFLGSRWDNYSEEKVLYVPAFGLDNSLSVETWNQMRREDASYKGIDIIRGGPLFIHQMAESFLDFSNMRDRVGYNYWVASRNATLANRQYCIDNPQSFKAYGSDFWGLSASDSPDGYRAFGAPHWIDDNGTITPTSGIASVYWTPKESISLAENLYRNHSNAWGRYGFSNGINPQRSWVGPDVIGIDLGMMLLLVENHRTGLIHRLTNSSPIVQRGRTRMGFVKVKDSNNGPLKVSP
jgi:hypothetical protein